IEDAGSMGTFPFDAKERRRLFSKSDHNPRDLLKFARERAIELSLKGLELPTEEKGEEKKSSSFSLFGLRFVTKGEAAKLKKIQKSEENAPLFKVVDKEKNKEDKKLEKEERATVSDEAKQQAEELEKMLREAVGEEPKETKVSDGKKPEKHGKKHKDNIHEHIIVSKR
ncbi:hypothetical protein GOV10_06795, partial [Candidatus Woesearchaeota archaeon]|nr:hypothetical protein [Candidatus Woesearchaeota archaeon]